MNSYIGGRYFKYIPSIFLDFYLIIEYKLIIMSMKLMILYFYYMVEYLERNIYNIKNI